MHWGLRKFVRHFIRHGSCLDGARHIGGAVVVEQFSQVVDDGSVVVAVAMHAVGDATTTATTTAAAAAADDTRLPLGILDALKQVEDDAGEAGVGQIDLLVIWHLPDSATQRIYFSLFCLATF